MDLVANWPELSVFSFVQFTLLFQFFVFYHMLLLFGLLKAIAFLSVFSQSINQSTFLCICEVGPTNLQQPDISQV